MKVSLQSDFPITDEACKSATGKTLAEWYSLLDAELYAKGRREAIQDIYNMTGRGKDTWWPTTIWVYYERQKGVVNKKDGLGEGFHLCNTKSVKASAQTVYDAFVAGGDWCGYKPLAEGQPYEDDGGNVGTCTRLRPGKDIRITWQTAGVDTPSQVDAVFTEKDGKTGINVNHARIQTREEADGLRAAWGEALNKLKAKLEG